MTVLEDAKKGKYTAHRPFGGKAEAYQRQVLDAQTSLRADLEMEYGMVDHPRRDSVWDTTKQYVRSTDAVEIARRYSEMVALVQPGAYRALKHLETVIREMVVLLDKGEIERVRNKMFALMGEKPGYRADIDAARAVLVEAVKNPNGSGDGPKT